MLPHFDETQNIVSGNTISPIVHNNGFYFLFFFSTEFRGIAFNFHKGYLMDLQTNLLQSAEITSQARSETSFQQLFHPLKPHLLHGFSTSLK